MDSCPAQPGGAQGPYNGPGCPAPPDSDGDGYVDPQDGCPSQAGGAQGPYNQAGCPVPADSDKDGYPDAQDGCPSTPGGAAGPSNSAGCPAPPDTDFDDDGVANQNDDCPNTAGSRDAEGCPDRDEDGLRDSLDACPDKKGPSNEDSVAEGNGCPDRDGDGLRDTEDACPDQGKSPPMGGVRKLDAEGCPIPSAWFHFPSGDTYEMAHAPWDITVCENTPNMRDCIWRIHVSLTASSAAALGLKKRELVDLTTKKTIKRSKFRQSSTGKWIWNPSAALTAALKRYGRSVTVILTGSFKVEGTGEWRKMDKVKLVIKAKPCGWVSYNCGY